MSTDIKCPRCGSALTIEDAVSEEYKRELRDQMLNYKKERDREVEKQREDLLRQERQLKEKMDLQQREFSQRLDEERRKLQQTLELNIRKTVTADFENQVKLLEEANREREEKLKEARRKELEFLQKEQELKTKEEELEIRLQKELLHARTQLSEQIRREELEKISIRETEQILRMRELEKQLEDQKKLAEEMRRKAEQGSMQLQGEAQELLLEEILRSNFPFDTVVEVGKGVEGADCMLVVRNHAGHECGKIIFESKRTKGWNNNWVEKLKSDMRNKQADLAILVSQTFPKGMECFGERDGVWICSFKEVSGLAAALRNAIIRISEGKKAEENKGEKMQMLYNFLTGVEFRQQVEAIVEGFVAMKQSILRERIQMEKLWKEREKQLEKVLINTSGMYGSIKGIAGASVSTIPLLEGTNGVEEEDDDMAH